MYFIPHNNSKWYSWAVHTSYLRRYGLVFAILLTVFMVWRFTIYAWLTSAISGEYAVTVRLRQQAEKLARAERLVKEMNGYIPRISLKIREYSTANKDEWMKQQFNDIVNGVQKAGINLTSYSEDSESKKQWGERRSVQLGAQGKFEQILSFLTTLKHSPHLIRCATVQCMRTEGDILSASCGLRCAILTSLD